MKKLIYFSFLQENYQKKVLCLMEIFVMVIKEGILIKMGIRYV